MFGQSTASRRRPSVAGALERLAGVGANVARAARDEDVASARHATPPPSSQLPAPR